MKKKTVKKVEHKVKPQPKKIEMKAEKVKHTHEVVKEVMSEPSPAAVLPDPPETPVNLAVTLPVHTPGLERC